MLFSKIIVSLISEKYYHSPLKRKKTRFNLNNETKNFKVYFKAVLRSQEGSDQISQMVQRTKEDEAEKV